MKYDEVKIGMLVTNIYNVFAMSKVFNDLAHAMSHQNRSKDLKINHRLMFGEGLYCMVLDTGFGNDIIKIMLLNEFRATNNVRISSVWYERQYCPCDIVYVYACEFSPIIGA